MSENISVSNNVPIPTIPWYQRLFGLKYLADIHSLILIVIALFLIYFPQFYPINPYLIVPWILICSWFCTKAALVNHNHQHCATFVYQPLNWILDLCITACIGYAACDICIPHNQNHHRYHGTSEDWMGVHIGGTGYGWTRLMRYMLKATFIMKKIQAKSPDVERSASLQRKLWAQRVFLFLLIGFLLWHNWLNFLLFMSIPCLIAYKRLMDYNHLMHDGCDLSSIETCTYNYVGKLENWLHLNVGFHTAHHMKPGLHWSLLPKFHDEIKHKIPEQYIYHSALIFYIRYLFSKKV